MTNFKIAAPRRQESRANLNRFWEVEVVEQLSMIAEQQACEKHFISNIIQQPDGRFVVRLPTKTDPKQLGPSRLSACEGCTP